MFWSFSGCVIQKIALASTVDTAQVVISYPECREKRKSTKKKPGEESRQEQDISDERNIPLSYNNSNFTVKTGI